MDANSLLDVNRKLKDYLAQRPVAHIKAPGRLPSAVLLPLFIRDGQHYMLFTRRTQLVRYHKGEISFPGGGYHSEDGALLNTALRESFEEIGLRPQDVEVLGELDDLLTRYSNYNISPFVGVIPPVYSFTPSQFEIAEIITVPLPALLEKSNLRYEPTFDEHGLPYHPYVYYYGDARITGATAAILMQFLEIYSRVLQAG